MEEVRPDRRNSSKKITKILEAETMDRVVRKASDRIAPPGITFDEMIRRVEIGTGCKIFIRGDKINMVSKCCVKEWLQKNPEFSEIKMRKINKKTA